MHEIKNKKFYLSPKFGLLFNKTWVTISELLQVLPPVFWRYYRLALFLHITVRFEEGLQIPLPFFYLKLLDLTKKHTLFGATKLPRSPPSTTQIRRAPGSRRRRP
jgi:hypothetical protein